MTPAVKLVFLLPTFDVGGAERAVARLAARLDRHRYEVVVAAFVKGSGRLLAQPELQDVRTAVIGAERGAGLLPALWSWLRQERPTVLLTYMFHANQAGRVCGRLAGVPVILCSERVVGWESRWRVALNRLSVGLTDVVTTNSEAGRRFWSAELGLSADRVEVIPNGVDTETYRPVERHTGGVVRLGVLARLHRANGHDWLLDGLAALRKQVPTGWVCVAAGEGAEERALRAKAEALGLSDLVEFTGFELDAPSFLQSLDIYIHPSVVSGMPNATLEAMAVGLPIVATAVGGTPEVVEDGTTGWLVDVGDVNAFVDKTSRLLQSATERRRMGLLGRERVIQRFSLPAVVDRTQTVVDRAIQEKLGLSLDSHDEWVSAVAGEVEEVRRGA